MRDPMRDYLRDKERGKMVDRLDSERLRGFVTDRQTFVIVVDFASEIIGSMVFSYWIWPFNYHISSEILVGLKH